MTCKISYDSFGTKQNKRKSTVLNWSWSLSTNYSSWSGCLFGFYNIQPKGYARTLVDLYKFKPHQKLYRFEFLSFFIIERDWPDSSSQFWHRQACLPAKIVRLWKVMLSDFNPKKSEFRNCKRKYKFFIPNRTPIIQNYSRFLLRLITWHPNEINLSFQSSLWVKNSR